MLTTGVLNEGCRGMKVDPVSGDPPFRSTCGWSCSSFCKGLDLQLRGRRGRAIALNGVGSRRQRES